jgi:hypothetical protein
LPISLLRGEVKEGTIEATIRQASLGAKIVEQGAGIEPTPSGEEIQAVISQLPGASFRALCVSGAVMVPSLVLPPAAPEVTEAMVLLALFAGVFVAVEYGARSPVLVEFRAARPYNRIRFATLLTSLLLVAIACTARADAPILARLVAAIGSLLGQATDVPGSPVRLLIWLMPADAAPAEIARVRSAAGLAFLVSSAGVACFAVAARLQGWPSAEDAANVWVNLPTFDLASDRNLEARLRRDAIVNGALGMLLPYVMPPLAILVARSHGVSMLDGDLLLVWTMTLWAFLPASLFLRGLAMRRLADAIAARRLRDARAAAPARRRFTVA